LPYWVRVTDVTPEIAAGRSASCRKWLIVGDYSNLFSCELLLETLETRLRVLKGLKE
jgi:hypothetical protein